ncbi:MAG: hypothetical protein GF411_15745 [Candidatus Lokiarchaeota archaeon]|nr:hypothetical protein [Candidatus Lokiarchaeota archaeon]
MEPIEIRYRRRDRYGTGTYSVEIEDGLVTIPQLDARSFDLSDLSSLKELKSVVIENNPLEELDLAVLSTCPNLETLSIEGSGTQQIVLDDLDLSYLSECSKFRKLSISSISIDYIDFSFLSGCPNFEELSLQRIQKMDKINISQLSKCKKLHRIEFQYIFDLQELDLSVLGQNTTLQEIVLTHIPLLDSIDLRPVQQFSALQKLVIADNESLQVLDIQPLQSCHKLVTLIISRNTKLTQLDYSALCSLDSLHELDLDRNGFLSLGFNPPKNIRKLSITFDSSFERVAEFQSVEHISILDSKESEINLECLCELPNLNILSIKDISTLEFYIPDLKKLTHLFIQNIDCKNTFDISSIQKTQLKKLVLNNISTVEPIDLAFLGFSHQLTELHLSDIFRSRIKNFSSINELENLRIIRLHNVRFFEKYDSKLLSEIPSLERIELGYFPDEELVDHSGLCLNDSLVWIDIKSKWKCDSFAWSVLLSHGKRYNPKIIHTGGTPSPYAKVFIDKFGWSGLIDKIIEAEEYWNQDIFKHEKEILDGLGIPIPDLPGRRFLDFLTNINSNLSFYDGLNAIQELIIEDLRKEFRNGYTTVMIDLDEVSQSGLAVLVPEILDVRIEEIENTVLLTGDRKIDLLPLACTAFGFEIIGAREMDQIVGLAELPKLKSDFKRLGIELKTTQKREKARSVLISEELKEIVKASFSAWANTAFRKGDIKL